MSKTDDLCNKTALSDRRPNCDSPLRRWLRLPAVETVVNFFRETKSSSIIL